MHLLLVAIAITSVSAEENDLICGMQCKYAVGKCIAANPGQSAAECKEFVRILCRDSSPMLPHRCDELRDDFNYSNDTISELGCFCRGAASASLILAFASLLAVRRYLL